MTDEPEPARAVADVPEGSADAIREAVEDGVDISLLRDNLKRTPAERLHRHQIALNTVEMLQKAKRP